MAVTSLSRFLRAHTCAPPRPTPTATTRGREGGGLHAQPLPRSVSPHTWRAPPSGSCGEGTGSKGDDAGRATGLRFQLSFIHPGSLYLFSLVVASLRVPRLSEKRKASGKEAFALWGRGARRPGEVDRVRATYVRRDRQTHARPRPRAKKKKGSCFASLLASARASRSPGAHDE